MAVKMQKEILKDINPKDIEICRKVLSRVKDNTTELLKERTNYNFL